MLTDHFKDAFRAHPAGVAVITAAGESGPAGITASSVSSVSAEPAILVFSLASATGSAGVIASAETIVVHLLGARNAGLADLFARPGSARFTSTLAWETLPNGEPLLMDVPRALRARVLDRAAVGSSVLVTAEVLDVLTPGGPDEPLVYHNRTYHRLGDHSTL
ncbi:flavin reductase family protein [Arthrobacter jiangjiafuii]|uniref:Flavin reductase family protein n=1 Tax=Arthrobacter jiangjiafuii TaxID=2817475 RepID=A0A975M640_9MICC|nr:flavin reductase family protein [Arthrobacter jiangjiafuii]MBP3042085.1 flavin reductase [Arthrobacter jiangjiafuii]QWC10136.1 flavin reductase family protein [Arthrobacter jiangjiafuii]